eukprot:1142825-Pelagomonas_calceolata.AAC.4
MKHSVRKGVAGEPLLVIDADGVPVRRANCNNVRRMRGMCGKQQVLRVQCMCKDACCCFVHEGRRSMKWALVYMDSSRLFSTWIPGDPQVKAAADDDLFGNQVPMLGVIMLGVITRTLLVCLTFCTAVTIPTLLPAAVHS